MRHVSYELNLNDSFIKEKLFPMIKIFQRRNFFTDSCRGDVMMPWTSSFNRSQFCRWICGRYESRWQW